MREGYQFSIRGDVPIIHWVSTWSSGSGWTPQRRCDRVSQKFQRYHENGTLKYMRTGQFNGYPVICIPSRKGGYCQEQDTIPKGGDAADTLQQMTDVRTRIRKEHLMLSDDLIFYENGEAYVDMDVFLNRGTVQEVQEVQETPSAEEELW
ncbi:MAG: hypothetical protein GDA38_15340 [Hormoscilla sp. SP12CHS1]|nr:hypothetical protein [Hormoscilla sp. SP12CHS1]